MNKVVWSICTLCVAVGAGVSLHYYRAQSDDNSQYHYITKSVTKGDIRNTVSATGTLAAVDDVIIGAQLSGQITQVLADFNDKVVAGQILAQIDPRSFKARVDEARAQVAKTEAEIDIQAITIARAKLNYEQAYRDYQRGIGLVDSKFISSTEFEQLENLSQQARLDYQYQQAQLKSLTATLAANQAGLDQAQIDLNHSDIRSPIDGFIINRTIEPGQTVASSLNTPELFTVAKDLTNMEIEAYIDESDIGSIAEEQWVEFTVDAFPDRTFTGQVNQIRHAPQSNSGVISYTVVIGTKNAKSLLLPGMTANLEIHIDAVRDVERIDNGALRVAQKLAPTNQDVSNRGIMGQLKLLNLSDEQKALLKERLPKREKKDKPLTDIPQKSNNRANRQKIQAMLAQILTPAQLKLQQDIAQGKVKPATVMILEDNRPISVSVMLGLSDSQYTQIIRPSMLDKAVITQVKDIRHE
ncbi:efflux RND transporter periplasmic adaptor subunit [Vibrio sp. SM6]|uniref:Efflux RND transporter periplasmic adaptor subunit n=1 Tax=Vibrio agarilyticus TaxID=2726741 RepID=A0A7X8TPV6_9VIBR|nr:efflux RND transporter periplasmic adaptor subunit [Vibrio agarilyticus]NLS12678.1 efflux RND transporter periplasmic adaptor subunit [Vibrio agarilyticus]